MSLSIATPFYKVVFLYKIITKDRAYCYTNSTSDISFNNEIYKSVAISHDDIECDMNEVSKSQLKVSIDLLTELGGVLLNSFDDFFIKIELFRVEVGSTINYNVEWKGVLTKVDFDIKEVQMRFGNAIYDTQRQGLRQVYQRLCPYVLYGSKCGVSRDSFCYSFDTYGATKLNDYQFKMREVPSYNRDLFAEQCANFIGGLLVIKPSNGKEYNYFIRGIGSDKHTVTVNRPFSVDLDFDYDRDNKLILSFYYGCTKTMNCCHNTFHNSDMFGGFPLLPVDNPISINHIKKGGASSISYKIDGENIIKY